MDKSIKIILYVLIGVVIINFLVSFFSNDNIRSIRQDLQKAKTTADSALTELNFSKSRLDSIKTDMMVFKAYLDRIEDFVALNDDEKRLREEKDAARVKLLKEDIRKRREEIINDSIPEIDVVFNR